MRVARQWAASILLAIGACVGYGDVVCGQADMAVDQTPLRIGIRKAYANLRLRRPIVFTTANEDMDRIFVASQYGVIYQLGSDRTIDNAPVFMDIEERVTYKDYENEEGFLGLAFHPRFRENGYFFVYYTTRQEPHTSVIARFSLKRDDPRQGDPDSELELLRIRQPFWNHNGGNLVFGPDGYLYISLGDGGAANDPFGNGQNLGTLFGSILRIDVDRQDPGKNYAIPKDNPFVGRPGACPEIYAYGLRNVWGLSFDPATGALWAADVGQDLWEEINLITKGGNYGWNLREGKHRFGRQGSEARPDLIDPIWEYHHSVGKSITGGVVYRGKRFPELVGCYLYADYITGKLWALRYDYDEKRVVANHPLQDTGMPIISFGVDRQGEVYLTDTFGFIYELERR
ncbi:MAG: protein up-regulated by thyroid hormone-PQQ-dependent glucose dehydrogenase [Pirellulaceae bacterium]|nr:MAG: protein up-regulated by thyroid hormone-PQQ-dependent glucose dehydrogenase [Pirellulaceae bacterium]